MKNRNWLVMTLSVTLLSLIVLSAGFPADSTSAGDLDCSDLEGCNAGAGCEGSGHPTGCNIDCTAGPYIRCNDPTEL